MPQIEPANIIAERLKSIALPPLVRPPAGPYDEPTEELVIWAVHNYAYSSIAHYRTILDGLMVLAASGNEPTMFLVYRHLYEWTMHGCYMLQNFKQHLDNGDLESAWELFLQADTANGWVKLHGAKYAPEIPSDDIPNTLRIKKFVAAYEKHQRDRGGTAHVQDDYGYLSEHSHPNGACLTPIASSQVVNSASGNRPQATPYKAWPTPLLRIGFSRSIASWKSQKRLRFAAKSQRF